MRLLPEVTDPPVASYIATLPECHSGFTSGVGNGMSFSKIAELIGFDTLVRSQRLLLRQFVKSEDKYFVVTFESLIGKKARNYAGFRAFTAIYCLTMPDANHSHSIINNGINSLIYKYLKIQIVAMPRKIPYSA